MAEEVSPLELLAYLNPKAQVMGRIPGWEGLSPSDIAAHLAKLDRQSSTLARYKYAGFEDLYSEIRNMLIVHIASHIITPKMNDKLKVLWPYAEQAISEVCDSRACKWCKGRGWHPVMDENGHDTGSRISCDGCHDGQYIWTDNARMDKLRIPKDQWKQSYSHLYSQVLGVVWGWDKAVADHMELLRKNI